MQPWRKLHIQIIHRNNSIEFSKRHKCGCNSQDNFQLTSLSIRGMGIKEKQGQYKDENTMSSHTPPFLFDVVTCFTFSL